MMKTFNKTNWLWVAVLFTAMVWAIPQKSWAADGDFDSPKIAFTWYSKGQGCMHLKLMTTNASPYRTLHEATYLVRDSQGTTTKVFYIGEVSSTNSGYVTSMYRNLLGDESLLYLTNDTYWKPLCFIPGASEEQHDATRNGKNNGYAELDWYFPTRFAGKSYTLQVEGKLWHEGGNITDYKQDIGTIEFDAINFEMYDIIPGAEEGDEGTVKIPFSCDHPVNWVEAVYKDEDGISKNTGRIQLPANSYSGYVKLPATEAHRDLTITANVLSGKPSDADIPRTDWKYTCTGNITNVIERKNDAIIHNPRILKAYHLNSQNRWTDFGAIRLEWKVKDPQYPDLLSSDQFLVQRSLTGQEDDFETIGSVMLDSKDSIYVFKDSTLISSLTPEQVDKNLGIPLVRYRVVRASTLQLWGIEKNPAVIYTQPQFPTFTLLTPYFNSAEWSNEAEHIVRVSWTYLANSNLNLYVWDDRAQMILHTYMYDGQNRLIDSTEVVLTEQEIQDRVKEITLKRSCVKYSMRIDVDSKDSPIGQGTGNIFALIRSTEDFEQFAKGLNDKLDSAPKNAILNSNITISSENADHWLGYYQDKPFTGNLNGNGYTLTVEWPTNAEKNVEYLAPIRFAGDGAVISNLTVTGTTNQKKMFAAGFVGMITTGKLFIENCTSNFNFDISSDLNDASSGGFVGVIDMNNGTDNSKSLRISNCLFNGSINLHFSTSCGGFVGWRRQDTFGMITNSYFNPESVSLFYTNGTRTFMRDLGINIHWGIIQGCMFSTHFGEAQKVQGLKSSSAPKEWPWRQDGKISVERFGFSKPISYSQWELKIPNHRFYYENLGHIDTTSVKGEILQSSFVLTWKNVDDQPVDYYEVWRRDLKEDKFQCISPQLVEMMYEDKTTSPVHSYEYFVRGVNNCEGTKYEDSKVIPGHCIQTGTVEGYLRLADGTGIAGYPINITSPDGSISEEVLTDESGYYRKDGLPYFNDTETSYTASPNINGFDGSRSVTFGTLPGENHVTAINFVVEQSVKFSGYVQYNGTSIPVQGVSFKVDGREVHTAAGKVTTDHEGKFSFRILEGEHSIQAVKDGHIFYQKGFYHENEDTTQLKYYFSIDKANILFYDDTRVKLIGRIAGGKEQEALPLDNSLSRNNLGNDLQMVLTLEGDNKSRLVWDNLDRNKTVHDTVYIHNAHDKKHEYQTSVHTTLNRMVVKPDVHTGEYVVWLPPVKWKIQQITAQGYATLFQDGKTGDVIDLTDSLTEHTDHYEGNWKSADKKTISSVDVVYYAIYNRIYHSPVLIEYSQLTNFGNFNYLGERYYTAKNLLGESVQVPLCYPVRKEGWPVGRNDSLEAKYTFDAPVFKTNQKYPLKISALERYYYNNNIKSDTIDVVRLSGGTVTIQNSLISSTHREDIPLDSVGEAIYMLEAQQLPYLLTKKDALRTVTMTLLMDGTRYEANPLRAYILNITKKAGARDLLSINKPELVDILRDPPGGGSSAKLSRGSTLKYGYTFDWSASGGLKLSFGFGTKISQYVGVVAIAAESGIINNGSSKFAFDIDLMFSGSGKQAYSYTMTANSDISTSSEKTMVGADADVYIGTETSYVVTPAVSIRAINESMWKQLQGAKEAGTLVEIACGYDDNGDTLHLVRDEVLSIGPKINSTFMHTQSYILKQLIPRLEKECKSLLFIGSKQEAQAVADSTGKVVYWSLREPDDDNFGVVNTEKRVSKGDSSWKYFYNDSIDQKKDGINYMIVRPSYDKSDTREDRIGDFCQSALWWADMIARNEREKLEATKLVKNFDIDGGTPLTYSEDFTADIAYTSQMHYFWQSPPTNLLIEGIKWLISLVGTKDKVGPADNDSNNIKEGEINWAGYDFTFGITPAATYNYNTPYSTETKYNRKESFTISMDKKSHLDVDVYALTNNFNTGSAGTYEVFSNKNLYTALDKVDDEVTHIDALVDVGKVKKDDLVYPRGFVYRTRGGATCRPWEPERVTKFYRSGTVLDERTKKIENPVITMDRQSISGVPFGEPARFKLYMTNESEAPEAVYNYFGIYLVERSNPKGAKVMLDGMPLTGDTRTLEIRPGIITEKTIEVWPSEDFDYENLQIGLISLGDLDVSQQVQFSVHYLQTAGSVAISTPGNKWILNTDAPYEAEKGWYIPVVINGFNKTQHNFDHIEFQYKESTRGDDYWTNLCGFYADSTLYRSASGTKAMIPENGNIITRFFGEGVEMEKAYDLRAVLFCRNGNGYLTNSSEILTGVKDTRRPQLFGTAEPKDGVLTTGANIIFNFSEPIEHNYLQATTNFEVIGETNETSIQENPSLLFNGKGYVESEARRNFANKSLTVEVMIKPNDTGRDMPIFSHGRDGKQLQLWLTERNCLRAVVDEKVLETQQPMSFLGFKRVALSLDHELKRLSLFGNGLDATLDSVTYNGYGPLIFGSTNQTDTTKRVYYEGRMLQARMWNRALKIDQLNAYGNQQLTGYEMGLTDYYPMNEGHGMYALDGALGAHLTLYGASWSLPHSMSLHLDKKENREVKGLKLKTDFCERNADKDYTLMFWFNTDSDGKGTLLANGAGRKNDVNPWNKFFIGFEGTTLKYRSNGHEYPLGDTFCDASWHHYAMTVNRSHQVASIYVDNELKAQFSTDSLGGMVGETYIGNMVWKEEGLHNDVVHQQNALTGHIDGLALFEQALPPSLIKRYTYKSLGGKEKGLITFLSFNRQEKQKNGELLLRPFALNQKVKTGADGQPVENYDSAFVEPIADILKHIDQQMGAPMQAFEELRNLNFSYVGNNHQLLVNIDELDSRVNKRTIYVTVSDVPDVNGNYMASPATKAVFVDRSPLRWTQRTYKKTLGYGNEDSQFDISIVNSSGAAHTYNVEHMPKWLSVSSASDVIDPQSEQILTFTIHKGINVGSYDEVIYLTDENGLAEPLVLNITIEGQMPNWWVYSDLQQFSMGIIGQVMIGNDIVTDSRDIVGVFDVMGRCMGLGNVNYNPSSTESLVFLTVYDSLTIAKPLFFQLWHYETGKTMVLTPSQNIVFKPETFAGTTKKPLALVAGTQYVQTLNLQPGWNWVSLNVANNIYRDVEKLLDMFDWKDGDMLTDEAKNLSLLYQDGQWLSNKGSAKLSDIVLDVASSYRVKVANSVRVELVGDAIKAEGDRTIPVKEGWNSIGYTPMVNLPIATALADYLDDATDGDVVKSQTEFAMFTVGANGNREWKGNLKYMKPDEGYMLYSQKPGQTNFIYPYFEPNATFFEDMESRHVPAARRYARNMSVVAGVDGIEIQEGDRLVAFTGGERVGETTYRLPDGDEQRDNDEASMFYLTISGETPFLGGAQETSSITFAIERDGDIIATSGQTMNFRPNAICGSVSKPTKISFATPTTKSASSDCYDLSGRKMGQGQVVNGKWLNSKLQRGVYIYNGRKHIIK